MPSLTQTKTLPYQASKIYDLVMDIEKYPEFLPWCKQAKIIKIISSHNLQADLLINFKNFFEKYRSNVEHGKKPDGLYFIDVAAIEGPFKSLINKWKIRDLENGKCEVEFFIEFEFNSIFLTKMIGVIFEKAAEKMMNAFEERALDLHRKNHHV
jgi:coenzyme Q-binding protein COQ10